VLPYLVMPSSVIHPKLAHLTSEEVKTLVQAYHAKQKVSDLILRFRIDCPPSQLYRLLPQEVSSELCPHCGAAMVQPRISQSTHWDEYKNSLRCPRCQHRKTRLCTCSYCWKNQKEQKATLLTSRVSARASLAPIKAVDLSLEQAVALLAVIRCYGPDKFKSVMTFRPLVISKVPLTPAGRYGEVLVARLVEADLLKIPDTSRLKTISFSKNNMAVTFSAPWSLPHTISSELIREIEHRVSDCAWPSSWYEQLSELAFDLALAECREFYDYCTAKRMFPIADEKSINAMLSNLLEDFSTGQCFRIIQSGAQYAADFLVQESATPEQAAQYMLGACQRWADKARAEKWTVSPFRRNFNCPRSMMSYTLYDFILGTHDDGLGTPIALIQLPAQK